MAELFEEIRKKALTTEQRDDLPEKVFGIPELRKYPLNDKKHVRQAVIMFNHVSPEYEEELAKNIIKAMAKFGVEMNVSEQNRFFKYYQQVKKYNPYHGSDGKFTGAGSSKTTSPNVSGTTASANPAGKRVKKFIDLGEKLDLNNSTVGLSGAQKSLLERNYGTEFKAMETYGNDRDRQNTKPIPADCVSGLTKYIEQALAAGEKITINARNMDENSANLARKIAGRAYDNADYASWLIESYVNFGEDKMPALYHNQVEHMIKAVK